MKIITIWEMTTVPLPKTYLQVLWMDNCDMAQEVLVPDKCTAADRTPVRPLAFGAHCVFLLWRIQILPTDII